MAKINHILIATDGSQLAKRAAVYGADLARAFGARVTIAIVHDEEIVIPEVWNAVGLKLEGKAALSTEDIRKRIEENALANELQQTASVLGDLPAEVNLVNLWGRAADQICNYSESHGVEMIVIGSHGRTGIKRALLGSVSHAVANRATCAVTIVR